jgi:hypothetical protein
MPQAKLHEAQGERAAAAHYYALNLARLDAEGVTGADATEALLYLAEYAKVSTDAVADSQLLAWFVACMRTSGCISLCRSLVIGEGMQSLTWSHSLQGVIVSLYSNAAI